MNPTTNIAVRAARQAGSVIMRAYSRLDTLTVIKKKENDFVSEIDRNAEQAIIDTIKRAYPGHAILAEESGTQGDGPYQWIIDPLDGTTNYLHGFPQFSISIALRHRGRLETGVVYDPLKDEMFTAEQGGGALLNDRRIRVTEQRGVPGALLGTGIPFRDQRHMDAYLGMLKALSADSAGIRRAGSAALDFAYVAAGRLDGFWEIGLSEWDFAAGALIVQEAGGIVSDLSGGSRHMDTGNVICGNLHVQRQIAERVRPFLNDQLSA